MIKKIFTGCLLMACAASCALHSWAMPAKPGIMHYTMPDGTTVAVRLHGDERAHYFTSADGYVLLRDAAGTFTYARIDGGRLVSSGIQAANADSRSAAAKSFLATVDRDQSLQVLQRQQQSVAAHRMPRKVAQESKLTTFPTKGSPRALVILVEFADKKFTLANPNQAFSDYLSKIGYSEYGATGSVKDFFTASSNAQFTPQFDVYGPVTLDNNMSHYGGNDSDGNDIAPQDIVWEACQKLDSQIDFTKYDTDNDGVIDNVYLFYAGYGEADGGPASSIWPHSWDLGDKGYYFDGKKLNHYACSNELANGVGQTMAGIGVFCHEFSHVLGLPDLYSTTYSGAFTPGNWSLMDNGSYNNDTRTPPTHTAYERYCLGWIEPHELKDPANITMGAMCQSGHYNDAYILNTSDSSEYYIFENRQQQGWDKYIPYHGMLVWHINFNPEVWNMNICNVSKQYVDIVEADGKASSYNIEGDPFPGSKGVSEFTDDTDPSMITWKGERLHAPITQIRESADGTISFMFKGGEDIFDKVVAGDATNVRAGSFVANWHKVDKATGYLLSVYTKDATGARTYVDGYNKAELPDTASHRVTGLQPLTTYYYEVCATNGQFYSAASNEVTVSTTEPTIDFKQVTAIAATEVTDTSFVANWEPLPEAERYTVNVFTKQLGEPYKQTADFQANMLPSGWESNSQQFDSRLAYAATPPSLRLTADGKYLLTCVYPQAIREMSLWYRGNSSSADNSIVIQGLVDGTWVDVATIAPLDNTAGGQRVAVTNFPDGVMQAKITLRRPGTGSAVIDDVTVGYGGEYAELPLKEWKDVDAGLATSLHVTGLKPSTVYSYSVVGHNADLESRESNRVQVTLKSSGVERNLAQGYACTVTGRTLRLTVPADAQVAVVDVAGRTVASRRQSAGTAAYQLPAAGIYIVRAAQATFKVAVR